MEDKADSLNVTIIRPQTDETPKEVRIGLAVLARLIAHLIEQEARGKQTCMLDAVKLVMKGGDL